MTSEEKVATDATFISVASPDAYEAAIFKEAGFSALALVGKRAKVAHLLGPSMTIPFHSKEGQHTLKDILSTATVCWIAEVGSEVWCNVIRPWVMENFWSTYLVIIFCGTEAAPWLADSYFKELVDNHSMSCRVFGDKILASSLPLLDDLPSDSHAMRRVLAKRIAEHIAINHIAILRDKVNRDLPSVDKQPRGKKSPLLIQPYRVVLHLQQSLVRTVLCKDTLRVKVDELLNDTDLHIGRLLVPLAEMNRDDDIDSKVPVGIFWRPWEYVEQTKFVQSPYLANVTVDMEIAELVINVLEKGPSRIKKEVFNELARWKKLKDSLVDEEEEVRKSMHQDVRAIMKDKSLVLLEKLAKEVGIEDSELMSNLREGFPLTGSIGPTSRWLSDVRLANMTEDEHAMAAKWIRAEVIGKCNHTLDAEAQKALAAVTDEEVELGYLLGPYTPELALERAGPALTYARRFILKQKDKWRPIDDFSVSRTNSCLTTLEKAKVDSLDEYLALSRFMVEAAYNASTTRRSYYPT